MIGTIYCFMIVKNIADLWWRIMFNFGSLWGASGTTSMREIVNIRVSAHIANIACSLAPVPICVIKAIVFAVRANLVQSISWVVAGSTDCGCNDIGARKIE